MEAAVSPKVGDVLARDEVNALPERSVVVCDEGKYGHNVLIRAAKGFDWYTSYRDQGGKLLFREKRIVAPGPWTLVYLPPARRAKVGDVITTTAAFAALPLGAVALDLEEGDPERQPAIKVQGNSWLYYQDDDEPEFLTNNEIAECGPHKVIHLPPSADADAGSAAA